MSFDFSSLTQLAGPAVSAFAPETGAAIGSIFANKPTPPPAPAPAAPIFTAANATKSAPVAVPTASGIPTSYIIGAGAVVGLALAIFLLRK